MPFRDTSVNEERIRFVIEASQSRANKKLLCEMFGITRRTGDKWLERYHAAGSLIGVQEQSRRPRHSPTQTSPELVERIVVFRRQYDWGARKIVSLLERAGVSPVPSESTVNRVLKRQGLVPPAESHPPATKRFERSRCNELWQMDFKGEYRMGGQWCYPLSLLDDHSRYLVGLRALPNQRTEPVQGVLVRTFERCGVPEGMLMDRGTPWRSNPHEHGLTRLGVFLIKQGIRLLFGRVRHPQTQGKVERFHRTLHRTVRREPALPTTLSGFQWLFDAFAVEYNQVRPHESLAMATPGECYQPGSRVYQPEPPEWDYPVGATVVKLNPQGSFDYRRRRCFVSEALAGQYVQLERLPDKLVVRFRHMYVREINETTGRSVTLLVPDDNPNVYTMS